MVDRCHNSAVTPNAAYPSYGFTTSANTTVNDTKGLRSEGSGNGHVLATCQGNGAIVLSVADGENPTEDPLDLTVATTAGPGRPSCSAS